MGHRHQATEPGDQKGDQRGGDRRCHERAKPVAIGQQAHRHGAQQRQRAGERNDDGDDGCRRAESGHD